MMNLARRMASHFASTLRRRKIRLLRDEGGQAIIFAVLMLSVIVLVLMMGVNVAYETNRRVELQSAADAAVLSAAAVHNRVDDALSLINSLVVTLVGTQMILQDDWFYLTALGCYLQSFPPWACEDCRQLGDSLLTDSAHYRSLITSIHDRLINPSIQSLGATSDYLHANVPQMAAEAALKNALGNRAERVLVYQKQAVPWKLVPLESNADLILNAGKTHKKRKADSFPRKGGPAPVFTGISGYNYHEDREDLDEWAKTQAPPITTSDQPRPTPPPAPSLPSFRSGGGKDYEGSDCKTGTRGCASALNLYISGGHGRYIPDASEVKMNSRIYLVDTQRTSPRSGNRWITYANNLPASKKKQDKNHTTSFQVFKACYLSERAIPAEFSGLGHDLDDYGLRYQETCARVLVKDWGTTDTYILYEQVKGCKIPLRDPVSDLDALLAQGLWPLSIPQMYILEPQARQKTHQVTAIVYQQAQPSLLFKNRFSKTRHGSGTHAATQCGMAWASAEVFNREDPSGSSPGWTCRLHPALDLEWLAAASAPEGEDPANSVLRQAIGRIRDSEAAATRRDWHDTLAH